jgi:AcrR family transcriptional regulator
MSFTKQRILSTCLQLFNEQGVAAVSSKTMSEALGLSQGNLAYHYPKKEDIITALIAQRRELIASLFVDLERKYLETRRGTLQQILGHLTQLLRIVEDYRFLTTDLAYLSRRYPLIKQEWKTENETMAGVAEHLFQLGVKDGYLHPESEPGRFAMHIHRMQIFLNFWVIDDMAREQGGLNYYANLFFDDYRSLLTPKGEELLKRWMAEILI